MYLLYSLIRWATWLAIAALTMSALSGLSSALFISTISSRLSGQSTMTVGAIGYLIGLILLVITTDLAAKWALVRLSATLTYRLRMQLVDRITHTPLRRLEQIGNPTLTTALVEDVRSIALALNQLPNMCVAAAIILGCTLYLTWLSPMLFLILLALGMPTLFIYRHLQQQARTTLQTMITVRDERDTYFEAVTAGAKELQLNQRRRRMFLAEMLEPALLAMQRQAVATRMYHAIAQSWSQTSYFVFIVLLLALAYRLDTERSVLTGYAVTALFMKGAINQLLSAIPQWTEATVALQKIERLQLGPEHQEVILDTPNPFSDTPSLQLSLSAITHSYHTDTHSDPFTLGPLDMHFGSGELVFITGTNGSGKTTLLKVLAGLYEPESGGITLNQVAVTAANRQHYREFFSVVFSDFYLFDRLLGMEPSTVNTADLGAGAIEQQAISYLAKLQLTEKVTLTQGRLSTINLSQGQRKRLALLTAYLEDRPIYLFDEWAANQDPQFKEIFYRQLLPELVARGKLVIAITHDEHYFALADRLLHLEAGQLISETLSPAY